jgi:hypothetical protein
MHSRLMNSTNCANSKKFNTFCIVSALECDLFRWRQSETLLSEKLDQASGGVYPRPLFAHGNSLPPYRGFFYGNNLYELGNKDK